MYIGIALYTAYVIFLILVGLVFTGYSDIATKLLKFIGKIGADILYEFGKTLFMAGLVGITFLPEQKDFTDAIIAGIIFYIIGYATKKD